MYSSIIRIKTREYYLIGAKQCYVDVFQYNKD